MKKKLCRESIDEQVELRQSLLKPFCERHRKFANRKLTKKRWEWFCRFVRNDVTVEYFLSSSLTFKVRGRDLEEVCWTFVEKVAIKILDRNKLDIASEERFRREISSIEVLHHPNIIRLYEVIELAKEYYIVTEFVPEGTLQKRITMAGKINESDGKYFFAQITAAVDHMVSLKRNEYFLSRFDENKHKSLVFRLSASERHCSSRY